MIIKEIINKKTGEKLIGFKGGDFENVKSSRHYYDTLFVKSMILQIPDELNGTKKPTENGKKFYLKQLKIQENLLIDFVQ